MPYVNEYLTKSILDKEHEDELRYCLNWGCEQQYKQVDNKKQKLCQCHPGIWDFGHTGMTIVKAMAEINHETKSNTILWNPHWTCCRQQWNAQGCHKTSHKGPLLKDVPERKYKWPNEGLQKSFHKIVSDLWRNNIMKEHEYNREKLLQVYERFEKYNGSGGVTLYKK